MNFESIKLILKKIKTWGLIGVWDFFKGKVDRYFLSKYFKRNLRKYPYTEPERGVTLIGNFYERNSCGKTWRDIIFAMHDAGIPYQTYNLCKNSNSQTSDITPLLTKKSDFRIGKYRDVMIYFDQVQLPEELGCKVSRWAFWEYDSGMLEFFHNMKDAESVIAMSDYNYDYFKRTFPEGAKVSKLLYPFRSGAKAAKIDDIATVRRRYGIDEKDFVVFFNFDYNSSYFRKNPDGAMRAFAAAFRDVSDAKLVFKTNHASTHKREADGLRALAEELGIADRFVTIDSYLTMSEVYSLTNACDIYLSLHRGEGFGLGVAEAMSLGKAVVVTDYSATIEFCKGDNAFLVPYSIRAVGEEQMDNPCYTYVTSCAEPDIERAAEILRQCYEDRGEVTRRGLIAKDFIEDYFAIDKFRESVNLGLLGRAP